MKRFAVCDSSGAVVREYTGMDQPVLAAGQTLHEVPLNGVDFLKQYRVGDKFVPIPPSPGGYVKFSAALGKWVPDEAVAKEAVLAKRQMLLQQSDWTQLPDVPLATKETWAIYRQTLRDITEQTDPFNINWPVQPDRKS